MYLPFSWDSTKYIEALVSNWSWLCGEYCAEMINLQRASYNGSSLRMANTPNANIICLPGAKLQWIAKTVRNLPPDTACNRLVVVAGGNDVADSNELQDAVNDYETVITEAKKRFTSVVISSVPPRLDNEDFTAKIDHFNAQLCKMADDNGCQFTNHHDTFHLASGRINDGYYDRDGVHPNPKATNKMAESLGLISKADSKDTATRDAAKKNHHRQDSADEESAVDTTHPLWQRVNAKGQDGGARTRPNKNLAWTHEDKRTRLLKDDRLNTREATTKATTTGSHVKSTTTTTGNATAVRRRHTRHATAASSNPSNAGDVKNLGTNQNTAITSLTTRTTARDATRAKVVHASIWSNVPYCQTLFSLALHLMAPK